MVWLHAWRPSHKRPPRYYFTHDKICWTSEFVDGPCLEAFLSISLGPQVNTLKRNDQRTANRQNWILNFWMAHVWKHFWECRSDRKSVHSTNLGSSIHDTKRSSGHTYQEWSLRYYLKRTTLTSLAKPPWHKWTRSWTHIPRVESTLLFKTLHANLKMSWPPLTLDLLSQ